MAAGGVGYFATGFFELDYWQENYWVETAVEEGSGSSGGDGKRRGRRGKPKRGRGGDYAYHNPELWGKQRQSQLHKSPRGLQWIP